MSSLFTSVLRNGQCFIILLNIAKMHHRFTGCCRSGSYPKLQQVSEHTVYDPGDSGKRNPKNKAKTGPCNRCQSLLAIIRRTVEKYLCIVYITYIYY
jgi:hypothetical protein